MSELQQSTPNPLPRPSLAVRALGIVLLLFSVGLVSCQAMLSL